MKTSTSYIQSGFHNCISTVTISSICFNITRPFSLLLSGGVHWRIQGGAPGTRAPPGVKILSFSCSFRQNICKIIGFWELAHPLRKILDPPLLLPGLKIVLYWLSVGTFFIVQSEFSVQSTTKDVLKATHCKTVN